jgi:MFS family permease
VFVALTLFAVGAIICAVSKNFTEMLVGRSIQGIGAGGIISLTEIIITDMVPLRERGKWFGFISGMWAIGSVSGPIVGGAFAQNGE